MAATTWAEHETYEGPSHLQPCVFHRNEWGLQKQKEEGRQVPQR
jgi:hypothetical protein